MALYYTETRNVCVNGVQTCQSRQVYQNGVASDWAAVADQHSHACNMADKPNCNRGGRKDPGNYKPIFDYLIKRAHNGNIQYFGAIVEGEQEYATQIPKEMYLSFTGEPKDTFSKNGLWRIYKPLFKGEKLKKYNKAIALKKNYSQDALDKALSMMDFRSMAFAELDRKNIPVSDRNDLFEIYTKYYKYHPKSRKRFKEVDYNRLINAHTTGRDVNKFDWGGLISGVMDGLFNIIDMSSDNQVVQDLVVFVNNYKDHMRKDFADINRHLQEYGPERALEALLSYKNGSWNELTQFLINWCNTKGIPFPPELEPLVEAQGQMESDLRDKILASGGTPPSDNGGSDDPAGGPNYGPGPANPNTGSGFKFDINKLMIAAAALLFFVFLIKK